jgi:hypothetical protein
MRLVACKVINSELDQRRSFTVEEFGQIQRAQSFIGSVKFWHSLDRLANPEPETRFHARLLLQKLAELAYADCGGHAYSPQHGECLTFCGLRPLTIRPPGSVGKIDTP